MKAFKKIFISLSIVAFSNNAYAKKITDYPLYLQSELQLLNCQSIKDKLITIENFYSYDYEENLSPQVPYILNKSTLDQKLFNRKILKTGRSIDYEIIATAKQKKHLQNQYTWALFYNLQLPKHLSKQSHVKRFQLKLRELGQHNLFLIQKIPTQNCLVSHLHSFYVTSNPSYSLITEKKFQEAFSCYQTHLSRKKNAYCANLNLPSSEELYHLQQVGAPKAWDLSKGEGVSVALIDSGTNYLHPYLREQIIAPHKNSTTGPYDFEFHDQFAFDENGHGSQMAGFISSAFGVAPKAKTLTLKINPNSIQTIIQAFKASITNKVSIINLSLRYFKHEVKINEELKSQLLLILDQLLQNDILVIQAAGNNNHDLNIPLHQSFFSQFNYPNWITVTAHDENFNLASYANYSNQFIDIIAPGGSKRKPLLSTFLYNTQGVLLAKNYGTSQATAITSGVAALIRSQRPYLNAIEVKKILLKAGKFSEDLSFIVKSGRILNAWDALNTK